jgi:hypothetical protein
VGYDRETMPSFQGNFAQMDRVKTNAQLMLGGVFVVAAKAEVTFVRFGDDPADGTSGNREDIHLLGALSGEYRVIDWFAITAEANYWQNFTDYVFLEGGDAGDDDPAEYNRFEGLLGVRAFL